jgi:hypothetical protein
MITSLATELLQNITSHLHGSDYINFRKTCKRINYAIPLKKFSVILVRMEQLYSETSKPEHITWKHYIQNRLPTLSDMFYNKIFHWGGLPNSIMNVTIKITFDKSYIIEYFQFDPEYANDFDLTIDSHGFIDTPGTNDEYHIRIITCDIQNHHYTPPSYYYEKFLIYKFYINTYTDYMDSNYLLQEDYNIIKTNLIQKHQEHHRHHKYQGHEGYIFNRHDFFRTKRFNNCFRYYYNIDFSIIDDEDIDDIEQEDVADNSNYDDDNSDVDYDDVI